MGEIYRNCMVNIVVSQALRPEEACFRSRTHLVEDSRNLVQLLRVQHPPATPIYTLMCDGAIEFSGAGIAGEFDVSLPKRG
jgi:hypothetical protein